MDKEIEIVLKSLKIDRRATRLLSLRNMLLTATAENAKQIIEHLNLLGRGHYVGQQDWSESEPYYYVFEAFAWEILLCHDDAVDRASRATSLFGIWSSRWNEAMSYWLLGIACRNNKHIGKAEEELKRARDILKRLASLPRLELSYEMQRVCKNHIDTIQHVINDLPWPSAILPATNQSLESRNEPSPNHLSTEKAKGTNITKETDYREGTNPSYKAVPEIHSESGLGYLGSSLIIVNRPSITDRLIRDYFIRQIREEDLVVIFPLYMSDGRIGKNLFLDENPIFPRQTYFMKREMQSKDANVIKSLRTRLHNLKEEEKRYPIVVILDIIQKWSEELESQVRYLVQEASYRNLSIWIHSSLFLIPTDLLPTIGTIVIIQPSRSEVKLLEEHFPSENHEFESKKDSRGFFIYNKRSSKGWQFVPYSP